MTPSRAQFIELDALSGWQSTTTALSPVAAGLAVDCVTGQPQSFPLPAIPAPALPVALAHGAHSLYLLDDALERVQTLDLERQTEFVTLAGIGGTGGESRQLRKPRGLALCADGALAIADTGHHQVKIFSPFPYALLAVWGGEPGSALGQFNAPWKVVADPCGLLYVADRGNGRVQRILRDGTGLRPIVGLADPTGLALGPDGTLAVLDGAAVCVYAPGQVVMANRYPVAAASCLTFDGDGYLYVGTRSALIYKFARTTGESFRSAGIGVTGVSGRLLDLLWTAEAGLLGILLPICSAQPLLKSFPTCGSYAADGILATHTLDSGIENCLWDRILLDATLPAGTVIEVTTQSAPADIWAAGAPFLPECSAYSATNAACALLLSGKQRDCLVQSKPGRYLRAQFKLKTNGLVSPTLTSVQLNFPRESYLQYLPAVYSQDDRSRVFLDRFLRIFQTTFDGMDRTLDDLWTRFDPASVPSSWFAWLAAWIAMPINPLWTDAARRAALKAAGGAYRTRGTAAGVAQLATQYSGVAVRLIEHFRLRQLTVLTEGAAAGQGALGTGQALGAATRLWSRDYYRRLQVGVYSRVGYFDLTDEPEPDIEPLAWGANEFTVFFDCHPYQVQSTRQKVSQAVEQEKPAYTQAHYAPVFARMRVGVQSTIGVDTRIGEYTPLLLGSTGTLDYDSILAGSPTESQLHAVHATLRPRIDLNTRLL